MDQRAERLFSYGTLQQEDVQRATFERLLEGAPDALVGFAQQMVEITDPDVLAKSGKRFHPIVVRTGEAADRVVGTVFLVTPEELSAADAYEVDDYERVRATLASGLDAWVYVKRVTPTPPPAKPLTDRRLPAGHTTVRSARTVGV